MSGGIHDEVWKNLASPLGERPKPGKLVELQLSRLKLHKNIRDKFTTDNDPLLAELAISIYETGLQMPITAYEDGDAFIIKQGHRRYSALVLIQNSASILVDNNVYHLSADRKADLKIIQVILVDKPTDEIERTYQQFAENSARKELDNLEKAEVILSLLTLEEEANRKPNKAEIGRRLGGLDRSIVSKLAAIAGLSEPIKQLAREIQLFGMSSNKRVALGTPNVLPLTTTTADDVSAGKSVNAFTVLGINHLFKIVSATNPALQFWYDFGSKCTEKDAELIGLDLGLIKKKVKPAQLELFAKDIISISKQFVQRVKALESMNDFASAKGIGKIKDALASLDTLVDWAGKARPQLQKIIEGEPSAVQVPVQSTKQTTTTTNIPQVVEKTIVRFEDREYDFSNLTASEERRWILACILDVIFYNRHVSKKPIINLYNLVKGNLEKPAYHPKGRAPDVFLEEPLDKDLERYILAGCPPQTSDAFLYGGFPEHINELLAPIGEHYITKAKDQRKGRAATSGSS